MRTRQAPITPGYPQIVAEILPSRNPAGATTLLVVSSVPGEGAGTVAEGIARTLSAGGLRRVLLISDETDSNTSGLTGGNQSVDSGGPYEWIVVHGPPILASPESVSLATHADAAVLVVRAHATASDVVARAAVVLRESGVRIVGAVLCESQRRTQGQVRRCS